MAGRPVKENVDYAGWSVDVFDNDTKIDKLMDACGCTGFVIYFYLCQRAYGSQGYYFPWCFDDAATTARKIGGGADSNAVRTAVEYCLSINLFSQRMFEEHSVLTSRGIQKRHKQIIMSRRNRTVDRKYWLLTDAESAGIDLIDDLSNYDPDKFNKAPDKSNYSRGSKVKESISNDDRAGAREDTAVVSVAETLQNEPDEDLPADMRDTEAASTLVVFAQEHGEYNITPAGIKELYGYADRLGHDLTRHIIRKAGTMGTGPAKKSWAYVSKILLSTEIQRIKTIAEYDAREAARSALKQSTGPPSAPKRKKVWIEKLGRECEIGDDGKPIMAGGTT